MSRFSEGIRRDDHPYLRLSPESLREMKWTRFVGIIDYRPAAQGRDFDGGEARAWRATAVDRAIPLRVVQATAATARPDLQRRLDAVVAPIISFSPIRSSSMVRKRREEQEHRSLIPLSRSLSMCSGTHLPPATSSRRTPSEGGGSRKGQDQVAAAQ